jgi:hypothetical protein
MTMPNPDLIVVQVPGATGPAGILTGGQNDKANSLSVVLASDDDLQAKIGPTNETVPDVDTAPSGLNGRMQRIAQGLTSLLALLPSSIGQKAAAGSISVTMASNQAAIVVSGPLTDTQIRASALPVSAASLPLPSGAASAANQATGNASLASIDGKLGGTIATAPIAGENHIGQVGGAIAVATASFQRPADTLAYAVGDAILDSTTAATVNANTAAGSAGIMRLHVARATDKTGMIRRLRLKTNDTAFAAATVRVHLFRDRPTVTNGDNGPFLTSESNYIGYADVVLDRHFSDAEKGLGVPAIGSEWNFDPAPGTDYIHATLETRTAITTPGSAKTWTLAAEAHQN